MRTKLDNSFNFSIWCLIFRIGIKFGIYYICIANSVPESWRSGRKIYYSSHGGIVKCTWVKSACRLNCRWDYNRGNFCIWEYTLTYTSHALRNSTIFQQLPTIKCIVINFHNIVTKIIKGNLWWNICRISHHRSSARYSGFISIKVVPKRPIRLTCVRNSRGT